MEPPSIKKPGFIEKASREAGVTYKYSASWIHQLESADHWQLYWRQQKLMEGHLQPGDRILEIGVGSGFTANYLRSKGYVVTTLDIDEEKKPDIIANVASYDFPDAYDHVLAFEVFEHLPYENFERALSQIARCCRKTLFLSVPRASFDFASVQITLPKFGQRSFTILRKRRKIEGSYHFWEIGLNGISLERLKTTLQSSGFSIVEAELFSHRFFIRSMRLESQLSH